MKCSDVQDLNMSHWKDTSLIEKMEKLKKERESTPTATKDDEKEKPTDEAEPSQEEIVIQAEPAQEEDVQEVVVDQEEESQMLEKTPELNIDVNKHIEL